MATEYSQFIHLSAAEQILIVFSVLPPLLCLNYHSKDIWLLLSEMKDNHDSSGSKVLLNSVLFLKNGLLQPCT